MSREFLLKFNKRKVDYREAVDTFYMSKGIACICCNVSGIDDVINPYSVRGYEMLNESLVSYINSVIGNIPVGVPVALELCGGSFTEREKKTITDAVWNHYELELGKAQKVRTGHFIRIAWFVLFFVFAAIFIFSNRTTDTSKELMYVLFYFLGDRMIDYIVFGNRDVELNRIRAAQLVSMNVIFREEFIDDDLSDEEAERIKAAVTEHTKSTEI